MERVEITRAKECLSGRSFNESTAGKAGNEYIRVNEYPSKRTTRKKLTRKKLNEKEVN